MAARPDIEVRALSRRCGEVAAVDGARCTAARTEAATAKGLLRATTHCRCHRSVAATHHRRGPVR